MKEVSACLFILFSLLFSIAQSHSLGKMIIRVRTQLGTWKVRDVNAEDTIADLKSRVEKEHNTNLEGRDFTSQPGGSIVLPGHLTVSQAGLSNGDQVYLLVDEEQTSVHEEGTAGKVISKEGNIVAKVRAEGRKDEEGCVLAVDDRR